jgi:oxygen-independent coproporphyrinogen-3 oxidase
MSKVIKHLYVHIPFCKSICTYCDFVRFVKDPQCVESYIKKLIKQIQLQYKPKQFQTIYVGGGAPNYLSNKLLNMLLRTLNKYLDKHYEFTIECNPELLTYEQAQVMKSNGVNRGSIGVQTVNNTILKKFHRQHTLNDVKTAIANLRKVGITNISIDLIYGFNEQTNKDILDAIKFIKMQHIPHVSWYALEVKDGSILSKQKYQLNDEHVEQHLALIIKHMHAINYNRYEVSSWSIDKPFESQHNKAY